LQATLLLVVSGVHACIFSHRNTESIAKRLRYPADRRLLLFFHEAVLTSESRSFHAIFGSGGFHEADPLLLNYAAPSATAMPVKAGPFALNDQARPLNRRITTTINSSKPSPPPK
jgi:hypothetical protein